MRMHSVSANADAVFIHIMCEKLWRELIYDIAFAIYSLDQRAKIGPFGSGGWPVS